MARRGERRPPKGAVPAPAVSTPPRFTRSWLVVAILLATGVAAWFAAGALIDRVQARRLPPLPDLTALSAASREQIETAFAAARRDPASSSAVGELGRAYHAVLLIPSALDLYTRAARLANGEWRWTYHAALLREERGEQQEAEQLLRRVVQVEPAHGIAWFRLAEIAFKEARLDEAVEAYARARDARGVAAEPIPGVPARTTLPLSVYAKVGLARISLERRNTEEARAQLAGVVKEAPTFGPARSLLVQLDARADSPPSAVADGARTRAYVPPADPWLDAVVARSFNTDLLLKHAALAARGGDKAWREFLVRRAVAANPQALDVLLEMAALLQETGRPTEALEYLKRSEAIAPGDHHVLVEQGRSLSDLGRLDEAEAVLRRAVRIRDAAAEYNLATVLDRRDQWDEARTHYERALEIDPFHARTLNNLAVGLDRRGRSAEALALLNRSLQAAPTNAETYSNLGSVLIGARRMNEAISVLQTSIALDPESADAQNNLGIALAQTGQLAEALRAFERALALNPRHVNARRNRDRVAEMVR